MVEELTRELAIAETKIKLVKKVIEKVEERYIKDELINLILEDDEERNFPDDF